MQEVELRIPSVQPHVELVGILHRKQADTARSAQSPSQSQSQAQAQPQPRRIVLILHGLLAHKNQCYHRALAQALPVDSYRFDFRGNADSKGDWTMGSLDNDLADLSSVIRHLHRTHGYTVDMIVAHSRGSMVSWIYLSRPEQELQRDGGVAYVPNLVVASGRWTMQNVLTTYARFQHDFDKHGFYRWQITSAGEKKEYIVWPNDLQQMAQLKTPVEYVASLSPHTHVLILHGTADRIVDQHDAHCYLDALNANPKRSKHSHRLQLVQGADHMYRRCTQPVVHHICAWYAEHGARNSSLNPHTSSSPSRL